MTGAQMPVRKILRTIILGTVLAALGIYWLAHEFDIDTELLLSYLLGSAIFVFGCVGLAAVTAVLIRWLRRS